MNVRAELSNLVVSAGATYHSIHVRYGKESMFLRPVFIQKQGSDEREVFCYVREEGNYEADAGNVEAVAEFLQIGILSTAALADEEEK